MMIRARALGIVVAFALVGHGAAWAASTDTEENIKQADNYYAQGKFDQAAAYYDRAIANDPKGVAPAAYAKRAGIFFVQKKYEDGLKWIDSVGEKAYPGDPDIDEQKALMLQAIPARRKEAVPVAEDVVKKKPSAFIAQRLIGDFYRGAGSGSADKTITAYEAYLKYRPGENDSDVLIVVSLGYSHLYKGTDADNKRAEELFNQAVKAKDYKASQANARKGLCATYVAVEKFDKAITICEQVLKDKKALRGDPSPYYNVGRAYLNRNKLDDALAAANSYIGFAPNKANGYILRAKVFERQNKNSDAIGQLDIALTKDPNNTEALKGEGELYATKLKQPKKAIALLSKVQSDDVEVKIALAKAYLADDQPKEAATTAEKALTLATAKGHEYALLALAGDAYYDTADLPSARKKYEAALAARPNDAQAKSGLVDTINREALLVYKKGDVPGAEKLLLEAYGVDGANVRTNFNLGLLAIEGKKYADAIRYLSVRLKQTPDEPVTNRLLAKAYLNSGDRAKAIDFYMKAEKAAKDQRANPLLAEIYTEWAPLLLDDKKVDDAGDKIELAAQYAVNQPFEAATKRNFAVIMFRRGYDRWKARKGAEAVADLEAATKEPKLLQGNEEDVFDFALGVAYLSTGQEGKAGPIFSKYNGKSNLTFLKAPFDKIGGDFFNALVLYRTNSSAARVKAAKVFDGLAGRSGALGPKLRELVRGAYEGAAYEEFTKGNGKAAKGYLDEAKKAAGTNPSNTLDHNLAVLGFDKATPATFEKWNNVVPESLVNYGILQDRAGDPKKAYEAWVAAKGKGVKYAAMEDWIDAKKSIFGYN